LINTLGIVLLVSPLANFQIDVPKAFSNICVVETKQQIIQAVKASNEADDPDLEIVHFLGRARAYSYKDEFNFIIRSANSQHANSLLDQFISGINSSAQILESLKQGMGKFNAYLMSENEVSLRELHDFVDDVAKSEKSYRRLVFLDGLNALATKNIFISNSTAPKPSPAA
jgi:hypothetical protein